MPDSRAEQILQALYQQLVAGVPLGVELERNATLPARIPPGGWLCLRDGDPGQPEVTLSPMTWHYQHDVEIDMVVDLPAGERDAAFDQLRLMLGAALSADRTLGGLCDWLEPSAPAPVDVPLEGGDSLKAATVTVAVHYATSDPLA